MSSTSLEKQKPQAVQAREGTTAMAEKPVAVPRGDIYETSNEIVLVLDVPGVQPGHVDVTLEQDVLAIFGKATVPDPEGFRPAYREYLPNDFRREFRLSTEVDRERITAQVKDGVLLVTLPKAEQAKPHKIAVTGS